MKKRSRISRTKQARRLFRPEYEVDLNGISVSTTTYAKLKSMLKPQQNYMKFRSNE